MDRRRLLVRALLTAGLVVATSGCGGSSEAGGVLRVRPGDCFDDPAEGGLTQADLVACDRPHDNEVFATVDHPAEPGAAFPGRQAMVAFAEQACLEPFAAYVGLAYDRSRFSLLPTVPTATSWQRGDRQVVCALYDHQVGKLTGSVRGSGR